MKFNNSNKSKSVKIYYFNKLKRMRFNKFEIYLGTDKPIEYFINDRDNYIYNQKVQIKDYEKFGLIDSLKIDIQNIIIDSRWENLEQLIDKMNSSKELIEEVKRITKNYLEDILDKNKKGDFEIGDFSFSFLIDGEKYEVYDYNEKRRRFLFNTFIYSSIFFVFSGLFIQFFVDVIIGSVVFILPSVFYFIWVLYKLSLDSMLKIKYDRDGENIFYYYLLKLPIKIVFYSLLIVLIFGWFLVPGYFLYESTFYYFLLEYLGGYLGEVFWGTLYFFIMFYLGDKILKYINNFEKKIKSYFN